MFNLHDAMEALVKCKVANREFAWDSDTLPSPPEEEAATPEGNPDSKKLSSDLTDVDNMFNTLHSTPARDANGLIKEESELDSDAS